MTPGDEVINVSRRVRPKNGITFAHQMLGVAVVYDLSEALSVAEMEIEPQTLGFAVDLRRGDWQLLQRPRHAVGELNCPLWQGRTYAQ